MSVTDLLLERSISNTVEAIEQALRRDRWERVEQGATLVFALAAEAEREGSASR